MFEWSDDDEVLVAPPPSTKAPLHNVHTGVQSRRGEEVPEQWAMGVLEQQTEITLERQAERVLERQAEERPTVEKAGPPPQSTGVDPMAMPGGSSRPCLFKKLYRQTKP